MLKFATGATAARLVLAFAACGVLCACYPALKTEQPKVRLSVSDAGGMPLAGVSFTLATFRYPFPTARSTTFAKFETDDEGQLRVRQRRDLLMQMALADGSGWYDWAYCIEKPGYRAVVAIEPDFSNEIAVVLQASATPSVCKWPTDEQSYRQVEIGEP